MNLYPRAELDLCMAFAEISASLTEQIGDPFGYAKIELVIKNKTALVNLKEAIILLLLGLSKAPRIELVQVLPDDW
jgi:hypothetical protein